MPLVDTIRHKEQKIAADQLNADGGLFPPAALPISGDLLLR